MNRATSHFQKNEPPLETLLRYLRYKKVKPFIKRGSTLLDLGCGYNAWFLNKVSKKIRKGTGVDFSVNKRPEKNNINLLSSDLNNKLPFKSNSFDQVTALAIIEHLDNPEKFVSECKRVLKKKGELIITTPHIKSRRLLETLAKLSLISKHEIADHKVYFNENTLKVSLKKGGFSKVNIEAFELGLNLFARCTK